MRVKIVVHDFSSYDPTRSQSGSRRPEPRVYCPREDQDLLFEDPIEILLYENHYYPIFNFGTFPNTSLPHYHGKEFIPATGRSGLQREEASRETAIPVDRIKDPSPNLTPDLINQKDVLPAVRHIQHVTEEKVDVEVISPERGIKAAEKDENAVRSDPRKPDLNSPKAPRPAKPIFNLNPPEISVATPPSGTSPQEDIPWGQYLLKGLALGVGGGLVVGGLVAVGNWLRREIFKKQTEKEKQRILREIEGMVGTAHEEGPGDETLASAKW